MSRTTASSLIFGFVVVLFLTGCGGGDEGLKTETPDNFAPPPTEGPGSMGGAAPPVTLPNKPPGS